MNAMDANVKPGGAPWTPEHTRIIVRGMVELILADPTPLYRLEGIFGVVDNHGNDRTGKKVDQILRGLASAHGLDPDIVSQLKRKKGGKAPSTPKSTPKSSPSKKAAKRARKDSESPSPVV